MTSIYSLNTSSNTDSILTTIQGQTDALEGDLSAVRTELTAANASPLANSWQARLQSLVDAIGVAASPAANSLQARIQGILDAVGVVASPATNSLQARIQGILDAVGVSASPAANSLQARIQSLISNIGALADAAATSTSGSFSINSLLKFVTANIGLPADSAAASESSTASVIAFLKLIATRQNARLSTAPTTSSVALASSVTAVNIGTAAGRGFCVYNIGTVAILIRRNTDPTASVYEIEIPAGSALYSDEQFSGTIRALLKTGSTSQNVLVTIF